jgi:EAL domain-containing protein (putative c-di-GMP-specific phosphodiesterase class I)
MLRLAGCDAVQGHLFARPQPAENMDQLVGAAVV